MSHKIVAHELAIDNVHSTINSIQAFLWAYATYIGSPLENIPPAGEMSLALGAVQPFGTE